MSYAIGYIVYGVSLNNAPESCREDIQYIQECDLAKSAYSGNGESPLWIGSEKGSIDECCDIEFSELLAYQVTEEDKKIFEEDKEKLLSIEIEEGDDFEFSHDFIDWLKSQQPSLFITWGSS